MSFPSPIAGHVALSHWGVIRARGDEAALFLHSQLTHDFSALGLSEARLAGPAEPFVQQ
ncbi:MAG TPA: folate-binding protein, partial [Albitalea sp.]|nr:folate-binding protein [Albitalea sp.]